MSEKSDMMNVLRGRGVFYFFLSSIYEKPADTDFINFLKDFAPYLTNFAEEIGGSELIENAKILQNIANNADNTPNLYNELNCEYTSLFLLGSSSVHTMESVYLSPEKLMKQDPWEEVLKVYDRNGFEMPESFKESEDHIAREMFFMYFMSESSALAIENEENNLEYLLTEQKKFMEEHILRWIPEFCERVLEKAPAGTMLNAATHILKGYIEYDREFLQVMTTR
jgi:TorA maturation chaperone TorD